MYIQNYNLEDAIPKLEWWRSPTKEETPMKKYWTHTGSGQKFDTQDAAVVAAKKYMESSHRNYGCTNDLYILEAVACITFPTPSYEVVALDAKTPAA